MGIKLLRETPLEGIALLTLNRPAAMNAIDMELASDLLVALDALETDDQIRVIVLTGAGERSFCSGFDIHEMASMDGAALEAAFAARDPLMWRIAGHPKPVVAALNGIAYGAGALIAATADIRIGCPATTFKVTASGYGSANATWTLPRIVGMARAKEILMTGRPVLADEALQIGLLNKLAKDGAVIADALELAKAIAANPPAGVQGAKHLVNAALGRSYEDAYAAEFAWMSRNASSQSGAQIFSEFLTGRPAKD